MITPTVPELRRGVLAVSVLCDVDLVPADDGVQLPGSPPVQLPWAEVVHALGGHAPESPEARLRLAGWLRARREAADAGPDLLRDLLRPVGLPTGHLLHPGEDWVRERVLGGALELGLGAAGLSPDDPDLVVLLPRAALDATGVDPEREWPAARQYLEDMGALAAGRVVADPRGLLRPIGDCDAVTLLGARSLREALARPAGGMAPVVVPMRSRGWTRLSLIDPAFGPAAAAATDPAERGFPRPLLVTADEVVVVRRVDRPLHPALHDPAVDEPWYAVQPR